MENRYLPPARQKPLRRGEGPILHENISLSVLPAYRQVSNEPPSSDVLLCAMLRALGQYSWGRACLREAPPPEALRRAGASA
jgi:hypothetical protein